MTKTEDCERAEIASAAALREWLEANHRRADNVRPITSMKATPARYVGRGAVLDELIAFGWIDGVRRKLDAERAVRLIFPRKVQSWSESYKDRAPRLIEKGRMAPPGFAAIEAGERSGLWTFMDEADALISPPDLEAALTGQAAETFAACPDAYKRNVLRWLKLAKTGRTRKARVAKIVEISATKRAIRGCERPWRDELTLASPLAAGAPINA